LDDEFRKQCRDIGIEGVKLKSEIMSLARHLPETYDSFATDAKQLEAACVLYQEFIQGSADEGIEHKVLDALRFLIERGNTTTYEFKYGEKPVSVEEPSFDFDDSMGEQLEEETAGGDVIDFGDIEDGGNDVGELCLDVDEEIDFGNAETDFVDEIDFGDSGAEIDYSDNVNLDIDSIDTSNIVIEEAGLQGGVARNEEARSILDNRRTRTILIDDLEELSGFLTQRLVETESENLKFTISSTSHQNHDPQTLRKMIAAVDRLNSKLTEAKVQQLQMIRDSPIYADRVVDTLKQKQKLKVKVESSIESFKSRRQQLGTEKEQELQHMESLKQRTKVLQKQIESDISHRYNGRTVIISGF